MSPSSDPSIPTPVVSLNRDTTSPQYLRRRANNNLSAKKSRRRKQELFERTVLNHEQLKLDYNHLWREYDRLKTENARLVKENQLLRGETPRDLTLDGIKLEDENIELRDSHHEVALVDCIFFGDGL